MENPFELPFISMGLTGGIYSSSDFCHKPEKELSQIEEKEAKVPTKKATSKDIVETKESSIIGIDELSLTSYDISMTSGTKYRIGYLVQPRNYTENILIESDDEAIATVSSNRFIQSHTPGTTYIRIRPESDTKRIKEQILCVTVLPKTK